jgi:class 3 adenylate cyclase
MWRKLAKWRGNSRDDNMVRSDQLRPISWRQRLVRVVMVIVAAVIACAYVDELTPQFDDLEQKAYGERLKVDAQQNRKSIQRATAKIVLVTISDDTFDAFSLPPNSRIPRDYHAKVIKELTCAGAKVIAFDLFFEHLPQDKEQDEKLARLADSASASGRVLWACKFHEVTNELLFPARRLLQAKGSHMGHTEAQWSYNRGSPNLERNQDSNTTVIDSIRPFITDNKNYVIPALSLEAARLQLGLEKPPFHPVPMGNQWKIGSLIIPVEKHGTEKIGVFRIGYAGDPSKTFNKVPYELIYNKTKDISKKQLLWLKSTFENRIALIGDTRFRQSADLHLTPVGKMPGVEIHAHAIATLLQGRFIQEAPTWVNIPLLCLLALLVYSLVSTWRLRWVVPSVLLLLFSYLLFNFWLFATYGVFLHLVAPSATIVLVALGLLVERGLAEEYETRRTVAILAHVLGPEIIQQGVPTGIVTLVFTDLEGSAELSERHGTAFETVRDEHFNLLREAAKAWNGFEVETAGDSLFAVFARAADAVQFAIHAQSSLACHHWPAEIGSIRARIGMHTGEPFIGQDRRRLTFRGPVTNRAARIMATGRGGQILVSEATHKEAQSVIPASVTFLDCGIHHLKGIGEENLFQVGHPELLSALPSSKWAEPRTSGINLMNLDNQDNQVE